MQLHTRDDKMILIEPPTPDQCDLENRTEHGRIIVNMGETQTMQSLEHMIRYCTMDLQLHDARLLVRCNARTSPFESTDHVGIIVNNRYQRIWCIDERAQKRVRVDVPRSDDVKKAALKIPINWLA
jgi:hypothetical protein